MLEGFPKFKPLFVRLDKVTCMFDVMEDMLATQGQGHNPFLRPSRFGHGWSTRTPSVPGPFTPLENPIRARKWNFPAHLQGYDTIFAGKTFWANFQCADIDSQKAPIKQGRLLEWAFSPAKLDSPCWGCDEKTEAYKLCFHESCNPRVLFKVKQLSWHTKMRFSTSFPAESVSKGQQQLTAHSEMTL